MRVPYASCYCPCRERIPRTAENQLGSRSQSASPSQGVESFLQGDALNPRSFAYFDVPGKQWKADAGDYGVLVGHSSAEIELRRQLKLERALSE